MLDNAPITTYRVVILTLDAHIAGPAAQAQQRLLKDFPTIEVILLAAAEWAENPSALDRAKQTLREADMVFVTPVYEAGEEPIEGVDAHALAAGLKSRGHRSARTTASHSELAATLADEILPGDIIVCLGAGDITKWAATLGEAISVQKGAQ